VTPRRARLRTRLQERVLAQWFRPTPSPASRLAQPLSWLFGALAAVDRRRQEERAAAAPPLRCPVVVIGNLIAGGAGKTPATLAVVDALRAQGWRPGVVSRGHGRRGDGFVEVGPDTDARACGDEPLLIARRTGVPVAVGRDRLAAARELLTQHPHVDVLLADDGLQHRRLPRQLEVVVFDSRGIGNGLLLPAGPLREPWTACPGPNALVLYTEGRASTPWPGHLAQRQVVGATPFAAWRAGDASARRPLSELRGRRLFAPAGMAVPERFFAMLRAAGLDIEACPLPDHHDYAHRPWPEGTREVVTTEKDAVKLDAWAHGGATVWVVGLDLVLPAPFVAEMQARLAPLRHP
jgi:tetraacyldisaccharide 4'-kinase